MICDERAQAFSVIGVDLQFSLRVAILPVEMKLALLAGKWQWQDDGSIVVVYASSSVKPVSQTFSVVKHVAS